MVNPAHTGREGNMVKRSLRTLLVMPLLKQDDRTIPI
jgi:hypothetical protein